MRENKKSVSFYSLSIPPLFQDPVSKNEPSRMIPDRPVFCKRRVGPLLEAPLQVSSGSELWLLRIM